MPKESLSDLLYFVAVAREGSFTGAAKRLNITQSALSHAVKGLETRLGLQLLNRSTRNVQPTKTGEKLLGILGPQFEQMEMELTALTALRHRPAGTVRITAPEHAAETILWPVLRKLAPDYPDIKVEVVTSHSRTNIVAERFDAGIRVGEYVEKDMIAMPISRPMRLAVVGTPVYFGDRRKPETPDDLTSHVCINMVRLTRGDFFPWEFERAGTEIAVRVDGQLAFTSLRLIRSAALADLGLAFLPEEDVIADVEAGRLVRVLQPWCEPFPGYHMYYPSRRQPAPAFTVLMEALRSHGLTRSPASDPVPDTR